MSTSVTEQLQPLLPLLARMLGHRPSPATVWRWTSRGVKVGNSRVKLEAKKVGGKLLASPEAVTRFIEAQNQPSEDTNDGEYERTPETERRLTCPR